MLHVIDHFSKTVLNIFYPERGKHLLTVSLQSQTLTLLIPTSD